VRARGSGKNQIVCSPSDEGEVVAFLSPFSLKMLYEDEPDNGPTVYHSVGKKKPCQEN
jgi:hypothetical protein